MIPAHEEKHTTIAYYREPSADGARPGQYFINTSEPTTRPRYEAETLAFHEAVPGHHLQLAIMQELDELPAFRRFNGSTAYIEGWGLYTERLSAEMGLLSGDLDRLRRPLVRRVAGIAPRRRHRHPRHGLDARRGDRLHDAPTPRSGRTTSSTRWTATSRTPARRWPTSSGSSRSCGCASEARERQGDRFDIRRFHDAVLGDGALPLPVLRQVVERALP